MNTLRRVGEDPHQDRGWILALRWHFADDDDDTGSNSNSE